MRENLRVCRRFPPKEASEAFPRYQALLDVLQQSVSRAEEQFDWLSSSLSLRASLRSLHESGISIKQSQQSLEQNRRVKLVTQLAFVFIPLSFVTSVFGMNLDILSSGSAKAWMVVVGVAITYAAVLLMAAALSLKEGGMPGKTLRFMAYLWDLPSRF